MEINIEIIILCDRFKKTTEFECSQICHLGVWRFSVKLI